MTEADESTRKLQELQILEQNLDHILMQKQTIQLELSEISNALQEIKNSNDEVYRVMSSIMVKADKEKLSKDLEEKEKLLTLRSESIEKQEKMFESKLDELRKEAQKDLKDEQ